MDSMRAGATEIKERTGGRVKFKFYGGGVQGNDKQVLRKMRIGQLHGGAFTSNGLAEFRKIPSSMPAHVIQQPRGGSVCQGAHG